MNDNQLRALGAQVGKAYHDIAQAEQVIRENKQAYDALLARLIAAEPNLGRNDTERKIRMQEIEYTDEQLQAYRDEIADAEAWLGDVRATLAAAQSSLSVERLIERRQMRLALQRAEIDTSYPTEDAPAHNDATYEQDVADAAIARRFAAARSAPPYSAEELEEARRAMTGH